MKLMKEVKGIFQFTGMMGVTLFLTSCAATQTVLEHKRLEVSTRQSDTVFLTPVSKPQKTIYVSIKNTSDQDLKISPALKEVLMKKGYSLKSDPNAAHYLLQANILKVGKMSVAASQSALGDGYGSSIAGAVAGTALGSFTNSSSGMVAGGIMGGMLGLAADSLIKDVNYSMITDVQISEKLGKGEKVKEQFLADLKNGTASRVVQSASQESDYRRYKVRIVSNANKVNLNFPEARCALEKGLVKSISGIF